MSGTIRSRMEAQRDRHQPCTVFDKSQIGYRMCTRCQNQQWPCPDRVAADDTLTDLNNAKEATTVTDDDVRIQVRLIPDPDSRGAA